ncbi:response regulator [Cognatitamlana onchidii]|uniref:response regulator n=1 Tax=Cognatitamlana onchidii TaxID=2562860 RepID=UPI0010A62F9C|nr:response regulator [Algibacter onchidii]
MKINLLSSCWRSLFSDKFEVNRRSKPQLQRQTKNNNGFEFSLARPHSSSYNKRLIHQSFEQTNKTNSFTILIAEDDIISQNNIADILEQEHFKVNSVENGWEAICAFETCKYDLIIMDLQMPILNGCEATKAIRKSNKHIPVLGVTDYSLSAKAFEDLLFIGFNDIIEKPMVKDHLIDLVKNQIKLTHTLCDRDSYKKTHIKAS